MNKTIIININGTVFHIEEEAYEVLQAYMTDIKRHFSYSRDNEEIVTDIENRLAEMFSERLAELKSEVVTQPDVNDIIGRMGSASQFDLGEDEENTATSYSREERKLFRDPDNRAIGGVCAGLAHYFNTEPRWIRLITLLITLLWGTGLVIYAILWIILPIAKTRADKMAMKGEAVTLQNFKKNFEREMDSISPGLSKATSALGAFVDQLGFILGKLLTVLVKIIGGVIIGLCVLTVLTGTLGLVGSFSFWSSSNFTAMPFGAIPQEYRAQLFVCAFIVCIVPFIALFFFTLRTIFNKRLLFAKGSYALLIIWLVGFAGGVYYGARLGSEFSQGARFEENINLTKTPLLYLHQSEERFISPSDSNNLNIKDDLKGQILLDDNETLKMDNDIRLYIDRSTDGKMSLTREIGARGKTFEDALKNARNVIYRVEHTDSVLTLNRYFNLKPGSLFRGQEIKLTLRVPDSTRMIIDYAFDRSVRNYDLNEYRKENSDWRQPTRWIMTPDGLKCDSLSILK